MFTIEGKTFFTFGGASSHDIQGGILEREDPNFKLKVKRARDRGLPYRILGESWWPHELPTQEEMQEGIRNLEKVNFKVDYVITHCCSNAIQNVLDPAPGKLLSEDILTDYFQQIEDRLEYQDWYFGHYHMNRRIDEKHMVVYENIIKLR